MTAPVAGRGATPIPPLAAHPAAATGAGAWRAAGRAMGGRGGLALADQGVVSATSFLTALLIGRVVSPAELGRYTVALSLVLLFVEVQNSLIATPYTVARPRLSGRRLVEYTGDVTGLQLLLGGCAALAALAAALLLPGAATLAAMVAVAALPLLFREHLRRLSFAGFELAAALRLDLLVAVVQLVGITALAVAGRLSAGSAFAVAGAAAAVGAAGWVAARPGVMRMSLAGSRRAAPGVWRAGRWVLGSGVVWAVGLHACPWLLAAVRGSGEVGMWAAGMGLAALVNPLLAGVGNYLAPATAHLYAAGRMRGLTRLMRRTALAATALVLPLLVAAIVWGEQLVTAIYGPAYADTGALVPLLVLHLWMTALALPVSRALFALERADLEMCANLAGLAVFGAVAVWAVPAIGAPGAALALALAGAASNAGRALALRRLVLRRGA